MKKLFLLLAIILLTNCGESPTEPTSNPYKGVWSFVLGGGTTGQGTTTISSNGEFSFALLIIQTNGSTFTNEIRGTVDNSGSLRADIYYAGTDIGDASGKLSGTSGSGTFSSTGSSGSWAMQKK